MNKKAVFFTVTAIILVSTMYLTISSYKVNRYRQRAFIIEDRIKSVNYFIEDLEKDIERGSYIASFRALLALQQKITSTGTFIGDLDSAFGELVLNGTLDGEYMSVMNDSQLSLWIEKIKTQAAKFSITLNYTLINVNLVHIDPWNVETQLSLILNISDDRGTAEWIRNQTINSSLSIVLYEDPLYTVNTFGRVINIIEETNITDFVDGNDTTNLVYHTENSFYRESNSSPSYLMRLVGNLNSSDNGIESIVNLRNLETQGIVIQDKTGIDYIYFSGDNPSSWKINNTFNWLRIDNESNHLAIYEVENLTMT